VILIEVTGGEMEVQINYPEPSGGAKTLLEQSGERQDHSTALSRGSILF